jgi:putative FmdB family regulatory protein
MPLYEYRCEDCGQVIEVLQRSGDPDPATCEAECADGSGGGRLKRILSVPGRSPSQSSAADQAAPLCGSCGRVPGSCMADA